MALTKLERLKEFMPSFYQIENNGLIHALLKAYAKGDEDVLVQLNETKKQLYVTLASGKYLHSLGSNVGVFQPESLFLRDESFRNFIPAMSFFPKQIRSTMYAVLDIFWGPTYSRATTESIIAEPYDISVTQELTLTVDERSEIVLTFLPEDFANPLEATAQEIVNKINLISDKVVGAVKTDPASGQKYVQIYTKTLGSFGAIEVTGGSANSLFAFPLVKVATTKVAIYEINHRELAIKIPATIPLLLNTLKGSHHFHEDATLTDGWPGSFFYEAPSLTSTYIVRSIRTTLAQSLEAGQIYTMASVADASSFPNEKGYLVLDYGKQSQELFVPYTSRPNNVALTIDPTYTMQKDHDIGATIALMSDAPLTPKENGDDYGIYLNDAQIAERLVDEVIKKIKAAGVIVRFLIDLPDYGWEEFC